MKKARDIIIFTLFRTDHEYSSVSLSWAKEFAKNNRVFYVNHPYSIKDFLLELTNPKVRKRIIDFIFKRIRYEHIKQIPENFISISPTLTWPINWLPKGHIYNYFKNWNDRIVLRAIDKVINDFNLSNFIYLNCFDPYFVGYLPKSHGAAISIYQCIDDISQDPYSLKHGQRLEVEAVQKSDLVLVTSTQLHNILSKHNEATYVAHNAVDISIFEPTVSNDFERPDELINIKTPIIGFTGNLDHLRIDYGLLRDIALNHRNKTLVLVGPINSNEFYEKGLDKLPNVISTGGKHISELPKYLKYMDCTIIPFRCNTLTKSIYPLKINEYLAAGRSIVSTSFSEDIKSFDGVIRLADSKAQFIELIDAAIADNGNKSIEQRQKVAAENTWKARVAQFWQLIEQRNL